MKTMMLAILIGASVAVAGVAVYFVLSGDDDKYYDVTMPGRIGDGYSLSLYDGDDASKFWNANDTSKGAVSLKEGTKIKLEVTKTGDGADSRFNPTVKAGSDAVGLGSKSGLVYKYEITVGSSMTVDVKNLCDYCSAYPCDCDDDVPLSLDGDAPTKSPSKTLKSGEITDDVTVTNPDKGEDDYVGTKNSTLGTDLSEDDGDITVEFGSITVIISSTYLSSLPPGIYNIDIIFVDADGNVSFARIILIIQCPDGQHTGAAATCLTAQICTVCEYVVQAALGHDFATGTDWSDDAANHWYACSRCDVRNASAAHTAGTAATCTAAQVCTVCARVMNAALGHDFATGTDWSDDPTNHWYACSRCDVRNASAAHTAGAAATCTTAQVCTVCARVMNAALGHDYDTGDDWSSDEYGHWYACANGCGTKGSSAAHVFEDGATCTDDRTCTICNNEFAAESGHDFANVWSTDTSNHWYDCRRCGVTTTPAAHTAGAAATCTTAQVCTACGHVIAEALGHTGGAAATCTEAQTCTACGHVMVAALDHNFGDSLKCDTACLRGCGALLTGECVYDDDGVCTICGTPAGCSHTYHVGYEPECGLLCSKGCGYRFNGVDNCGFGDDAVCGLSCPDCGRLFNDVNRMRYLQDAECIFYMYPDCGDPCLNDCANFFRCEQSTCCDCSGHIFYIEVCGFPCGRSTCNAVLNEGFCDFGSDEPECGDQCLNGCIINEELGGYHLPVGLTWEDMFADEDDVYGKIGCGVACDCGELVFHYFSSEGYPSCGETECACEEDKVPYECGYCCNCIGSHNVSQASGYDLDCGGIRCNRCMNKAAVVCGESNGEDGCCFCDKGEYHDWDDYVCGSACGDCDAIYKGVEACEYDVDDEELICGEECVVCRAPFNGGVCDASACGPCDREGCTNIIGCDSYYCCVCNGHIYYFVCGFPCLRNYTTPCGAVFNDGFCDFGEDPVCGTLCLNDCIINEMVGGFHNIPGLTWEDIVTLEEEDVYDLIGCGVSCDCGELVFHYFFGEGYPSCGETECACDENKALYTCYDCCLCIGHRTIDGPSGYETECGGLRCNYCMMAVAVPCGVADGVDRCCVCDMGEYHDWDDYVCGSACGDCDAIYKGVEACEYDVDDEDLICGEECVVCGYELYDGEHDFTGAVCDSVCGNDRCTMVFNADGCDLAVVSKCGAMQCTVCDDWTQCEFSLLIPCCECVEDDYHNEHDWITSGEKCGMPCNHCGAPYGGIDKEHVLFTAMCGRVTCADCLYFVICGASNGEDGCCICDPSAFSTHAWKTGYVCGSECGGCDAIFGGAGAECDYDGEDLVCDETVCIKCDTKFNAYEPCTFANDAKCGAACGNAEDGCTAILNGSEACDFDDDVCDTLCNECGAIQVAGGCVFEDENCDTLCDVCERRQEPKHNFNNWKVCYAPCSTCELVTWNGNCEFNDICCDSGVICCDSVCKYCGIKNEPLHDGCVFYNNDCGRLCDNYNNPDCPAKENDRTCSFAGDAVCGDACENAGDGCSKILNDAYDCDFGADPECGDPCVGDDCSAIYKCEECCDCGEHDLPVDVCGARYCDDCGFRKECEYANGEDGCCICDEIDDGAHDFGADADRGCNNSTCIHCYVRYICGDCCNCREHSYGDPDCTNDAACTECGAVNGDTRLGHCFCAEECDTAPGGCAAVPDCGDPCAREGCIATFDCGECCVCEGHDFGVNPDCGDPCAREGCIAVYECCVCEGHDFGVNPDCGDECDRDGCDVKFECEDGCCVCEGHGTSAHDPYCGGEYCSVCFEIMHGCPAWENGGCCVCDDIIGGEHDFGTEPECGVDPCSQCPVVYRCLTCCGCEGHDFGQDLICGTVCERCPAVWNSSCDFGDDPDCGDPCTREGCIAVYECCDCGVHNFGTNPDCGDECDREGCDVKFECEDGCCVCEGHDFGINPDCGDECDREECSAKYKCAECCDCWEHDLPVDVCGARYCDDCGFREECDDAYWGSCCVCEGIGEHDFGTDPECKGNTCADCTVLYLCGECCVCLPHTFADPDCNDAVCTRCDTVDLNTGFGHCFCAEECGTAPGGCATVPECGVSQCARDGCGFKYECEYANGVDGCCICDEIGDGEHDFLVSLIGDESGCWHPCSRCYVKGTPTGHNLTHFDHCTGGVCYFCDYVVGCDDEECCKCLGGEHDFGTNPECEDPCSYCNAVYYCEQVWAECGALYCSRGDHILSKCSASNDDDGCCVCDEIDHHKWNGPPLHNASCENCNATYHCMMPGLPCCAVCGECDECKCED